MDLVILVPLIDSSESLHGLLPVQASWSTEPWELQISRHQLNPVLIPTFYMNLPDPNVKTREVLSVSMSHRNGVVYLYTKGVKEDILSRSSDSILCVDETFLNKLIGGKVIAKNEASSQTTLRGTVHKRGDVTIYQALLTTSEGRFLLLHLHTTTLHPVIAPLTQILHSGILQIPTSSKVVARGDTGKTSSLFVVPNIPPAADSSTTQSTKEDRSENSSDSSQNPIALDASSSNLTEVDILSLLPDFFSKASCTSFVRPYTKLNDTSNLQIPSESNVESKYPYLVTESQIQRGRDRSNEEEAERMVALHYLILLHSKLSKG